MKILHKMTFFKIIAVMMVFIIIVTIQFVGILKIYDSQENESEQTTPLVFEKYRVLLGLGTFHRKTKSDHGVWENGSPAPAPSPAETHAAGPVLGPALSPHSHLHHYHKHHRAPRPRPMLPLHRFSVQHKQKKKHKVIILIVLLSTGLVLVIFALGVFFVIRRFNRQKKAATRIASIRAKTVTSQNLATKVSHDISYDTFYMNTLTTALEPEMRLRGSIASTSPERNNLQHDARAEEIISVHEYSESSKNDSDEQSSSIGDKVVDDDHHSSGDESFHSFCESRTSSNLRLSNVSISSFNDPEETLSPNRSNILSSSQNMPSIPPPPPPPPPPLPFARVSPPKTSKTSNFLKSSPPPNNDLPSGSKEVAENELCSLPSTPKNQGGLSTIPPPPPPCPPPYPHNKGNTIRGQLTLPGQPPSYTTMGKDGNPLPKLKPLHWDKVRATPDRSMVWDKLRCSSFELDEETIESLFGYSMQTEFANDEGKSKSPSPSKHVLEPKRLQNITILSKALNVTAEKVYAALVQGEGLNTQQLEALIKMVPTKEEEAKLSSYKGEIYDLGSAEKLVKELLRIPHAFERVEAMLFKATFDDEVVHLRNSFSMLEEACQELRSSRLFLKILEAVLKTGNRMNVGTIRGGAQAFKLDALLKLADVKGTDGKTTLLHFVVQEIIRSEGIRMSDSIMGQIDRTNKSGTMEDKEDDYKRMGLDLVSGLSTELHNVKRTASLDLDVLATSVSNLSDGMQKLQQLADSCAANDNFVLVMKTFLSHAESSLKELQTAENMVLLSVRQITEYYHGDVSKEEINPLRIFVVVRDFLGMLDQVCRELKTLKTPRSPNPLAPFR
ncbi:formin-like protein 11 [Silene latifolia]|uniref:formin-like protein 11 n=1 Tax=Silene latifolia TaxID=37657 RepID=UPI003D7795A6